MPLCLFHLNPHKIFSHDIVSFVPTCQLHQAQLQVMTASRLTVIDQTSNEMNMHTTYHAGNKYVV